MGKVEEGDQFHSEAISLCLSSLEECDKPIGGWEGLQALWGPAATSRSLSCSLSLSLSLGREGSGQPGGLWG